MTHIQQQLMAMADAEYRDFESKLNPVLPKEAFLGVRVPQLRRFALELIKSGEAEAFLDTLPHTYFDENLLHSVLLSKEKDYATCIKRIEDFLPYIDNWAVSDTLSPPVLAKNKEAFLPTVRKWIASDRVYTCRVGIDRLMAYYLDDGFDPRYLEWVAGVTGEDYYVKMMVAWFFATALAKQWDATVPYIENRRLNEWTHRKTIQKACESFRITPEQKAYLKQLRQE